MVTLDAQKHLAVAAVLGLIRRARTAKLTTVTQGPSHRLHRLFLSYAPKDQALKDDLEKHLRVLTHAGKIETWSIDRVRPGDDWRRELDAELGAADIALLLLSSEFWTSDFLFDLDVPALYERHEKAGLRIIPVLLRSCYWEAHPWLGMLKTLPSDGVAIAAHDGDARDRAMVSIVREVARLASASASMLRKSNTDISPAPLRATGMNQPNQAEIDAFFVRYGKQQYLAAAKCSEAKNIVSAIARGLAAFTERMDAGGRRIQTTFPPSAPRIPSEIPRGTKYYPDASIWKSHPTWQSIFVTITGAMYFSYEIETSSDGRHAIVRALSDLNGDGKIVVFERSLTIDENRNAVTASDIVTKERHG